jgi:hypothetical protein
MPVARHIRKRTGDSRLCISEKSAGYLPIHLGGRAEGTDARTWRQGAQAPNRFAAAASVGASSAAAAAPSRWAALAGGGGGAAERTRTAALGEAGARTAGWVRDALAGYNH